MIVVALVVIVAVVVGVTRRVGMLLVGHVRAVFRCRPGAHPASCSIGLPPAVTMDTPRSLGRV